MAHRYSIPTKEVAILSLHTVHRGVKIYILKADTCISPKRHVNPNIMSSSCAKKILSFLENGLLKNNSLKPVKMLFKNCMKF